MQVVNPVQGVNDDRSPRPFRGPAAIESGDSPVGVQDVDLFCSENGGDLADDPEADPFAEGNGIKKNPAFPGRILEGAAPWR